MFINVPKTTPMENLDPSPQITSKNSSSQIILFEKEGRVCIISWWK
jgi:hypothetical protein